jgi:hypothetical protein
VPVSSQRRERIPPMRTVLAWLLGAALAANGLVMLADPPGW